MRRGCPHVWSVHMWSLWEFVKGVDCVHPCGTGFVSSLLLCKLLAWLKNAPALQTEALRKIVANCRILFRVTTHLKRVLLVTTTKGWNKISFQGL